MKNFKVFKILDRLKWIYAKAGVDYDMMKLILSAKLTMDGRRKATVFNNDVKKKKKDSNEFYKSLLLYAFIGLFFASIMIFKINIMYQMSMYFAAIMFMILTIFISDFSYVILDVRDKNIIATKGVNNKTINAAKITHVCIYIISLTLALTGFSLLAAFKYGIGFFLIFLLEIVLIDVFMIMITALAYLLVLKFFDGEKLKDMINFVQIALSVFMIIGYQIVPRIFQFVDIDKVAYKMKGWHYFIAPMWFAAPLAIIDGGVVDVHLITMSVLALVIPIASILLYMKLTPTFEKYLQKLNNNSEKKRKKDKLSLKLSNFICRDNIERAFFNFSIGIIDSEREFKLKVYPSMAMGVLFPFIFMMIGLEGVSFNHMREQLMNSKSFFAIYAFALMIPNILIMLRYSERYNGAWIYKVAPINKVSSIYKGVIKGTIFKLIIPPYIVLSIIFTMLFSFSVIKHLIVAFLSLVLIIILNFSVSSKSYPFSEKFEGTNNGDSIISLLFSLVFILIVIVGHLGATFAGAWLYIYAVVLLGIDILLWKNVFNISKKKLIEK